MKSGDRIPIYNYDGMNGLSPRSDSMEKAFVRDTMQGG